MSEEHRQYLKNIRKNKIFIISIQLLIIVFFIVLWQFLADKKIIDPFIFSSPKEVVKTIVNLHATNNLYHHIWVTLYEVLISFGLGTIIGIIIASLMWYNTNLAKILDPYLTILNSLPKIALGPIIIIWCGAGIEAIILMALLISVIVTIINIYQGFKEVDFLKIRLLETFNASKTQIFFNLILPSNYSNIISNLKVSISMSFIGIIMGEFLVSKEGLGYLILYGSQVFNLDLVISGIVILASMSSVMYYLVVLLEKKIINKN